MMSSVCFLALLPLSLASPSEYWALATPAVRRARSLQGSEAARALGGRTLSKAESKMSKVWCGPGERYNTPKQHSQVMTRPYREGQEEGKPHHQTQDQIQTRASLA